MPKPPKPAEDVNSEKELIQLVHELIGFMREDILALRVRFDALEATNQRNHQIIMTAIEELSAAVSQNTAGQAELTTAVNAAIVRITTPGPTDAVLLGLKGQVDSSTASDKALTDSLNAALGNTPPATP
jgi:hypothetical protein